MSRKKKPSEQICVTENPKKKWRLSSKIYFGLFLFLAVLSSFLFWSVKNTQAPEGENQMATATTLTSAIIAIMLAIFFGLLCFRNFIRSRSVSGGLFLTTAISTAVFLGASQFVGVMIPPAAAAFSADPAAANAGIDIIVILAQIGLFALWFGFLLYTIHVMVSPIKKVDHYLSKMIDGEELRRVRIGKSRQYKEIALKLKVLSKKHGELDSCQNEPPQVES